MHALVLSGDSIARENIVAYVAVAAVLVTFLICATVVLVKIGPPSAWTKVNKDDLISKPMWTSETKTTTITRPGESEIDKVIRDAGMEAPDDAGPNPLA